jgi:hypothetical protein
LRKPNETDVTLKSVGVPVGMDVVIAAPVIFLVDFFVVIDIVGPQSDVNDSDTWTLNICYVINYSD